MCPRTHSTVELLSITPHSRVERRARTEIRIVHKALHASAILHAATSTPFSADFRSRMPTRAALIRAKLDRLTSALVAKAALHTLCASLLPTNQPTTQLQNQPPNRASGQRNTPREGPRLIQLVDQPKRCVLTRKEQGVFLSLKLTLLFAAN